MARRYVPTSIRELLVEALSYGNRFGEWRWGIRHGDWWVWFGLPIASSEEYMRALPAEDRESWLQLDAEGRARFVLQRLWHSTEPVDAWLRHAHHLDPALIYGDLAQLLYDEIGKPSPIADVLGILGTQQAFDMAMDAAYLDMVAKHLRKGGIHLGPGLTDAEVDAVERRCDFKFPPDLRAFLQRAHPLGYPPSPPDVIVAGGPFPDWRNAPGDFLQQHFEGILDAIFFDIEHGFWNLEWGAKPADFQDACDVARRELATAPKLIPIFAHRYLPDEPLLAGNPIFSIHQTDIIHYGFHLADYFYREFGVPLPPWGASLPREIRVWTDSLWWRDNEFWPSQE